VKWLLDTHLLLWAASDDMKLPAEARAEIENAQASLYFSVVSIWEIIIKNALGRDDFSVNARVLRRELIDVGYTELEIKGQHVLEVEQLPLIHHDPFDRLLIAQASSEGIFLMTHDKSVAQYRGPIRQV
jgi:PIN domain nuclease of toxin-antitoxin system